MIDNLSLRALTFAAALLLPSILVLTYGFAGSTGNSLATGAAIAALTATLAAATRRRPIQLDLADIALGAIVVAAAISSMVATMPAPRNELIALALTLSSYLAARRLSTEDLPGLRAAVLITAGAVTAIGAPLTFAALLPHWDNDPHGRPMLFGLPSAATMLAITAGYLAIAAATDELTRRRLATWCAILFVPAAIAAASMVRFTLMATIGAVLLAAAIAATRRQRLGALAIAATLVIATACGLAARHQTAAAYMQQFAALAPAVSLARSVAPLMQPTAVGAPRTDCGVDTGNSLAIRASLLREAAALVPQAGPFGLGLDGFLQRDCLGMMPHNVILQALVEFGWIGGGALVLLMAALALRLLRLARKNPTAAFLACSLAYAAALAMVHGRLSRQNDLFLLLGAGAGIVAGAARQRQPQGEKAWKSPYGSSAAPS